MPTSRSPKASIFVPVHNNLDYTRQCLYSLDKCTNDTPFEVIIINNASTDDTREFLANYDPQTYTGRVITNAENLSFAAVNNQAAELGDGEYFVLLNNDTIVTPHWLDRLLEPFKEHEDVGATGSKLLRPGSGTIQHCGIFEGLLHMPVHQYFDYDANIVEAELSGEYFAVTGACMALPAELYERHKLDERYVYGWEDIDLCNKLRSAGLRILYAPKSVVYHYESQTPGRYKNDHENMLYYMSRWIQHENGD